MIALALLACAGAPAPEQPADSQAPALDSGAPGVKPQFEAEEGELKQALRKRFRIDLPALKAALKALEDAGGD